VTSDEQVSTGQLPVPPWRDGAAPIPQRTRYRWPNGASLAVYVAVGIEEYELGGSRVEDILEGPGGQHGPLLSNAAWRDYGNRVGGFRLIERMADHGIAPTVLLNTDAYDTAPHLIAAARAVGGEFVGHGTSNSHSVLDLSEGEERSYIRRVIGRIAEEEGRPPAGWSSPWLEHTPNSLRLLAEEGVEYTLDLRMDDQPVRLGQGATDLLAVPYALELNDSSSMVARRVGAREFSGMIVDEFDELLAASAHGPVVMSVVVHTFISGTPFRLQALTRALAHLTGAGDQVWFATAGQIAEHHSRMTA
jgi:peptidoglycan/xylan/chitin deacetylase (PgdA/CDA1 family)